MEQRLLIYIRSELNPYERRCPIVPQDIYRLIEQNYIIYIESSTNRIYNDNDYKNAGAIITDKKWYSEEFSKGLIIGLKELSNLEKLNNHIHVYFSHSYKNQINSEQILTSFKNSNSILYDFEYFLDNNNKRTIAFGYYAGYIGCSLGLLQYFTKKLINNNIKNLQPWNSSNELLEEVRKIYNKNINIAVIGANGLCGKSVIKVLDYFGINYIKYNSNDIKINLEIFDIVYNCIKLNKNMNETWIDENTIFTKPITIVDISCDYTQKNNPIKIYNKQTTWETPVLSYNNFVDIIAIDNLPSLLPKDSSIAFSSILINLLLNYNDKQWNNNKNIYNNIINNYNINQNYL